MEEDERPQEGGDTQTTRRRKLEKPRLKRSDKYHLQIELVNRGGKMVEIVKHCAFGVPPIIIGHHLDEATFFFVLL